MLADNIQMKRKRTRVPVLSILIMYFIFVKPPHNIETCSAFPGLQSNVKSMSWDFRGPVEEGVPLPNDRGKWAQWGSKHSLGHFSFPIQSNRFSFKWTGRHGWVQYASSTFFYLSNIWSQGSLSKLSLDEQSGSPGQTLVLLNTSMGCISSCKSKSYAGNLTTKTITEYKKKHIALIFLHFVMCKIIFYK